MSTGSSVREKRREERHPARGAVLIRAQGKNIEGDLIDVSTSGFRMAHRELMLAAGDTVEFSHGQGAGSARVVWNRIVDGRVETGFFVTEHR